MTLGFEPGLFDEARQLRVPGLTYVTGCVSAEAERALAYFIGLSLLAPCRCRLKRERAGGGWARETVLLAPRSAYLLEGEARHNWLHSIPPLTELRYSLTFRTLAQAR